MNEGNHLPPHLGVRGDSSTLKGALTTEMPNAENTILKPHKVIDL